jgi:hypothetical protein
MTGNRLIYLSAALNLIFNKLKIKIKLGLAWLNGLIYRKEKRKISSS